MKLLNVYITGEYEIFTRLINTFKKYKVTYIHNISHTPLYITFLPKMKVV